jgi:hypothetical protein
LLILYAKCVDLVLFGKKNGAENLRKESGGNFLFPN